MHKSLPVHVVICQRLILTMMVSFVLFGSICYGQSTNRTRVATIDTRISGFNPKLLNVDLADIKNSSRFGSLITSASDTFNNDGVLHMSTFAIGLLLSSHDSLSRIAYEVTFGTETIESEWGSWSTDSSTTSISGRYENFLLGMGYHYTFRPDKKIKFYTGIRSQLSFPVSASTYESTETPEANDSYKFFGYKNVGLRNSFPMTMALRIFRPVYFTFGIVPTINLYQLDGIRQTKFWVASEFGFRFFLQ